MAIIVYIGLLNGMFWTSEALKVTSLKSYDSSFKNAMDFECSKEY